MAHLTKGAGWLPESLPVGGDSGTGIAFDIGTTTIVGALVDLSNGRVLGARSVPNPQSRWGRDVVSRINAVVKDPSLLEGLSRAAVGACNEIIEALNPGGLTRITAAGNSVMEHLFLKVSPEPLSRVPYRPAFKEARVVKAREVGLNVAPDTPVYCFPLIGGFVGGDSAAVILCLGQHKSPSTILAIDIGTNSEIMLSSGLSIYAAAAAAGPAFEGGEISCGMSAQKGAIRSVKISGDSVSLDTIDAVAPVGICGSGLLDAISGLIGAGVIDKSGRIKDRDEVPSNLSGRIKEKPEGNSFVLYRGAKSEVALSQQDIRAFQTAKSAIRSGILMLLKKSGVSPADIQKVFLAGAFGSNLSKEALHKIGILDEAWLDRIEFAGDAALCGAALALKDEFRKEANEIASRVKYVSLSGSALFEKEFIRNIDFLDS